MTETRQDIQAQIDRLDLDWLLGLESYKHQYPFAKQLPVKGAAQKKLLLPSFFILPFVVLGFPPDFSILFSSVVGVFAAVVMVFAPVLLFREFSKQEAAYNRYQQALADYESERSWLQESLDALD